MIPRKLLIPIFERLDNEKALIILGPRQSGKTTLLNMIARKASAPFLLLDCDEPDIRKLLETPTSTALKNIIGKNKLVMIDEAQRIKNIGLTLKLIIDKIKWVKLVVTGSSALELADEINEPLTGRKIEYFLLPISVEEMLGYHGGLEEKRLLSTRLIYGMYPEILNNPGNEKEILRNLAGSYLYKDVFAFQDIRKPAIIERLLEALALQIGSLVSYNELAQIVGVNRETIQRYIDLLEKTFVVFRLRSFSRNVRNELKKSIKIYFYDNGIRNAIISNFQQVHLRNDLGALWENFLVSEKRKYNSNHQIHANTYFWRTRQQQEIDYIEERDGKLYAYKFKWNVKKIAKYPKTFIHAYPQNEMRTITPENFLDFLS